MSYIGQLERTIKVKVSTNEEERVKTKKTRDDLEYKYGSQTEKSLQDHKKKEIG